MKTILHLILSFLALTTSLSAQSLVKDVNQAGIGSNINSTIGFPAPTVIDNKMYFLAFDGVHGDEPWVSDGTEAGTRLLKDIEPGTKSLYGSNFYNLNGKAAFFRLVRDANFQPIGYEFWATDGTTAGTAKLISLTDIDYDYMDRKAGQVTQVFYATDGATGGYDIWRTDGTTAGTYKLVAGLTNISGLPYAHKNHVYFTQSIFTGTPRTVLWISDGSVAGTKVLDTLSLSRTCTLQSYAELGGKAYFIATTNAANGNELWETDGTNAGTKVVIDINPSPSANSMQFLTASGNSLYFWGNDGLKGWEIWKSDGTASGTRMVKDLKTGLGSSLVSTSNVSTLGFEGKFATFNLDGVWVSDGTEGGTQKVALGIPTQSNYWYFPFLSNNFSVSSYLGSKIFFARKDTIHGDELWVSDGTTEGTRLFKDIYPEKHLSANPIQFTRIGDKLYFVAADYTGGSELWQTDGTEGGTRRVKDINPKNGRGILTIPFKINNQLIFVGNDAKTGFEWYRSDGTAAGTQILKDIGPTVSTGAPSPGEHAELGNISIFSGNNYVNGSEPWRTDGTEAGTFMLKNLNKAIGAIEPVRDNSSSPSGFVKVGNYVYFRANDTISTSSIWRTDGSVAGTTLVYSLHSIDGLIGSFLREFKGKLFFAAGNFNETRLWQSNGTEAGTDLVSIPTYFAGSNDALLVIDSMLYFSGKTDPASTIRGELWRTDGTETGTKLVKKIGLSTTGSNPRRFYKHGKHLYFVADLVSGTRQLWRSDGTDTGTIRIISLNSNNLGEVINYTSLGNKVFFTAYTSAINLETELWATDGTEVGTVKIVGQLGSSQLLTVDNKVYFTGYSPTHGSELWETDGKAAGTKMLADIYTGTESSFATPLLLDGNTVYFSAESSTSLSELWRYNLVTKIIEPLKNDDRITAFPNPTEGAISFQFETSEHGFQQMQVLDMTGRLMTQTTISPISNVLTLDTQAWAQGTYLVRFIGKDKQAIKRIVKTE